MNCPCSVLNTKTKPYITCHSNCKQSWALWIYNAAIIVTHSVIFHPNFNHPWQNYEDAEYTKFIKYTKYYQVVGIFGQCSSQLHNFLNHIKLYIKKHEYGNNFSTQT